MEVAERGAEALTSAEGESGPTLSKKALKRKLKQEFREQKKRAKKEQQKQQKQAQRAARPPRPPRDPAAEGSPPMASRKERKAVEKEEFLAKMQQNFAVVIDVAWEDKHNERALRSLKQQIVFCYGFNKRHPHPVHIHLSGMGPLLREQLIVKVRHVWCPWLAATSPAAKSPHSAF